MIHILLCPHVLSFGGAQSSLHHWARHLDPSRFKISVLAMAAGGFSEKYEATYPTLYDEPGYPNIGRFISELKPDILHAAPGGGTDLAYITRAAGLTTVTQTVMCPRKAGNVKDVAASVVLSKFVLSLQAPGADNIVQIDAPFDTSDYDVKYGRAHFGLPENKILIGSLGNARKENSHFLKIARHYNNPDVHFAIKSNQKYKYLLGRSRITSIERELSEDEKLSFINCFDIFLYPTSNEAYGVVFLEAMSQKVPIVTYDDSANPETVGAGGVMTPLNDIDKMTGALDSLVKDKEARARIGQSGYDLFVKRNDPKKIAKQYEAFFEGANKRQR
ncbi:MAG: glycosyltransferase family 4 protein [Proteobacteria bacterium]|nr:glycosyltransferase family 4 protein [Pseudomonadota bacterium]